MKDSDFIQRLKQELPFWIKKGWIAEKHEAAILASVTKQQPTTVVKPSFYIFSFLGISLLAVGIILFFASNWQMIPKLSKLLLLFGSLWASYSIAAYLLTKKQNSPELHWFGQLLLLLGVVIFGANIWLIAQIYHIDAHFPNGILLWSLGAWLVAILLRQQACIVLSIVLALIWSLTENQFFLHSINWLFVPLFIINILPIIKERWFFALHIAFIVLILWLSSNVFWLYYPLYRSGDYNYFTYYFGLCALAAFTVWNIILGMKYRKTDFAFATIQHYAIFFLLLNTFYLTFPNILEASKLLPTTYLPVTLTFALVSLLSHLWLYKILYSNNKPTFIVGVLLNLLLSALLVLNYFIPNYSLLAIAYNLLFSAIILWIIALGYALHDIIYINLSFIFFAIFVIARYFDVFWDLLNRSLFFMVGGLVLLIGSYLLERKRRSLTQEIKASDKHPLPYGKI